MRTLPASLALALLFTGLASHAALSIRVRSPMTSFAAGPRCSQALIHVLNNGSFTQPRLAKLVAALKQVDVNNPQSAAAVDPVAFHLVKLALGTPGLVPGIDFQQLQRSLKYSRVKEKNPAALSPSDIGKVEISRDRESVMGLAGELSLEVIGEKVGQALMGMEPGQRDKLVADALDAARKEMEALRGDLIISVGEFLKKHPDPGQSADSVTAEEYAELKQAKAELYKLTTLFPMYVQDSVSLEVAKSSYKLANGKVEAYQAMDLDLRLQREAEKLGEDRDRLSALKAESQSEWALSQTGVITQILVKNPTTMQERAIELLTPDLLGNDEAKALKALEKLDAIVAEAKRDAPRKRAIERYLRVAAKTADAGRRERAIAAVEVLAAAGSLDVAEHARKELSAEIGSLKRALVRRDLVRGGLERETGRTIEPGTSLEDRIRRLEQALALVQEETARLEEKIPAATRKARKEASELAATSRIAVGIIAALVGLQLWLGEHFLLTWPMLLAGIALFGYQLSLARLARTAPEATRRSRSFYLGRAMAAAFIVLGLAGAMWLSGGFGALAVASMLFGLVLLVYGSALP